MEAKDQANVLCGVWAREQRIDDGTAHWCHAELYGFSGQIHPKGVIDRILKEKASSPEWIWRLVACKPYHDDSACEECKYQPQSRLWKYYEKSMPRHDMNGNPLQGYELYRRLETL